MVWNGSLVQKQFQPDLGDAFEFSGTDFLSQKKQTVLSETLFIDLWDRDFTTDRFPIRNPSKIAFGFRTLGACTGDQIDFPLFLWS